MCSSDLNTDLGGIDHLDHGREILGRAIEALVCLDYGNALLDRCVAYLRQLVKLIDEWGKCRLEQF